MGVAKRSMGVFHTSEECIQILGFLALGSIIAGLPYGKSKLLDIFECICLHLTADILLKPKRSNVCVFFECLYHL